MLETFRSRKWNLIDPLRFGFGASIMRPRVVSYIYTLNPSHMLNNQSPRPIMVCLFLFFYLLIACADAWFAFDLNVSTTINESLAAHEVTHVPGAENPTVLGGLHGAMTALSLNLGWYCPVLGGSKRCPYPNVDATMWSCDGDYCLVRTYGCVKCPPPDPLMICHVVIPWNLPDTTCDSAHT